MNRSMMHALTNCEARLARGNTCRVVWWAWMVVIGVGCAGCYQQTVVPPTTSIAPPMRPVPVIPQQPIEPYVPPTYQPIEPITRNNPWKPDTEARDWNYIVLHHTAASTGSVESIHEEHLKRKDKSGNHWLGIGYHFVIGNGNGMTDGEIEPTFRWRQQMQGAHAGVSEYNQRGIGIVLIGNFENDSPTEAQTRAIKQLVGTLKQEYGIVESKVVGHGDVKATECPGKRFPMNDVRDSLPPKDEQAAVDHSPAWLAKTPQRSSQVVSQQVVSQVVLRSGPTATPWNYSSGDSRK